MVVGDTPVGIGVLRCQRSDERSALDQQRHAAAAPRLIPYKLRLRTDE